MLLKHKNSTDEMLVAAAYLISDKRLENVGELLNAILGHKSVGVKTLKAVVNVIQTSL